MVQLVLITAPDEATAQAIARSLVEERLAACVNVVPGLTSFYRWEGEVQADREVLLLAKTTAEAWPRLQERVLELHPYTLPELLVFDAKSGLDRYLAWVKENVK